MKTLKSTLQILSLFSILLWSCQSTAQRSKIRNASPEDIATKQTKYQSKRLDLSDNQTKQLKSINLKYAKELEAYREKDKSEHSYEEVQTLKQKQNQEVKAILSEEQYQQYIALKNENQERLKKRREKRMKKGQNNQKQFQNQGK
ncbi:hypothetical protein [Flavobacterium sp. CS20]|uniref:hypothetical protein n=1 Tax=Flavobacterium sp. CS20 TaxID=2775246 RepID=UPI001B3A4CB6|nr:hypothetical protein [Flavobacterium sp. CS20]QTY26592.1 hypothetical protein IGB25_11830 [Flavobacterium sp. CS20]